MAARRGFRRRAGRLAALVLAGLVFAGCTEGGPPTRTFQLGDARRYASGEHRYRSEVTLRKAGHAPGAVAGVSTTLRVDLLETVATGEGKPPSVSVTVSGADASGNDASFERTAALGRSLTIAPKKDLWEITDRGGPHWNQSRVPAIDLILFAHLMAPAEPKTKLAIGERIPESASLPTAWSTARLNVTGASTLTDRERERGRRVSRYDTTLTADAFVSPRARLVPIPTEAGKAAAPAAGSRSLACLFTSQQECILPSYYGFSFGSSTTIDLRGPMTITGQATVHQSSGRLLSAKGQGRVALDGEPPYDGRRPSLELSWSYSETLVDSWPKDPLPGPLVALAVIALAAVVTFLNVVALMYWRRRS